MSLLISLICIFVCLKFTHSWNFKKLGLDEDKIELSGIAVQALGKRAFLAVPRLNAEQTFTLVEAGWPEHASSNVVKPFPDAMSQEFGNCEHTQSAIALSLDGKGRLYVLDKGLPDVCSAKIIIYHCQRNKKIFQTELQNVPTENLSSLVVDVNPLNGDIKLVLGDGGQNTLIIYKVKDYIWWKVVLKDEFIPALSREPVNGTKRPPLNQLSISKKNSMLYITSSESADLFSIDLYKLRHLEEPLKMYCNDYDYNKTEISLDVVGKKFGMSSSIFADTRGNLYYAYERDSAILKWDAATVFADENMEVLVQDYDLFTNIAQIFVDPQNRLWCLNSRKNKYLSYTFKV